MLRQGFLTNWTHHSWKTISAAGKLPVFWTWMLTVFVLLQTSEGEVHNAYTHWTSLKRIGIIINENSGSVNAPFSAAFSFKVEIQEVRAQPACNTCVESFEYLVVDSHLKEFGACMRVVYKRANMIVCALNLWTATQLVRHTYLGSRCLLGKRLQITRRALRGLQSFYDRSSYTRSIVGPMVVCLEEYIIYYMPRFQYDIMILCCVPNHPLLLWVWLNSLSQQAWHGRKLFAQLFARTEEAALDLQHDWRWVQTYANLIILFQVLVLWDSLVQPSVSTLRPGRQSLSSGTGPSCSEHWSGQSTCSGTSSNGSPTSAY